MAKFEKGVMEEALALNNGNVSATARALGCTRKTIYNYLHRHEDLGLVLTEARETLLDKAEEAILELIASGDTTAIIFTLKTRGKARGWSTTVFAWRCGRRASRWRRRARRCSSGRRRRWATSSRWR